MTVTARDICIYCGHLWDEHAEERIPETPYLTWLTKARAWWSFAPNGEFVPAPSPCRCCARVAERVKELNEKETV